MCLNHSCSDVSYIVTNWTPDFGNILEGSAYFKLQSLSYFLKHVFQLESTNEIFLKADLHIAI